MADNNIPSVEPLVTQDLRSDSNGGWEINVDQNIPPGQHVVNIEDEYGNQAEVLMYVVADTHTEQPVQPAPAKIEVIERITTAVPPLFSWLMVLVLVIIIFLGLNLLRLARRADKLDEEISGSTRRHSRQVLIFLGIIFSITAVTGLLINRETNFLSRLLPGRAVISEITLSGRLINPLTLAGVGNVDLVSGNTSLQTADSGQFIFDNVAAERGIRATSPALIRTLVFLPAGKAAAERLDIYFDPLMYNLLAGIIDLEARGRLGDVYSYLPAPVRAKISRDDFQLRAQTIFTSQNITDQEIIIKETKLIDGWAAKEYDLTFPKAVAVTVTANGLDESYFFVNENAAWTVVR